MHGRFEEFILLYRIYTDVNPNAKPDARPTPDLKSNYAKVNSNANPNLQLTSMTTLIEIAVYTQDPSG
jgi:hypothetical protein